MKLQKSLNAVPRIFYPRSHYKNNTGYYTSLRIEYAVVLSLRCCRESTSAMGTAYESEKQSGSDKILQPTGRSPASQKTAAVRWPRAWSVFFGRRFLWYFLCAVAKKVHSRWAQRSTTTIVRRVPFPGMR